MKKILLTPYYSFVLLTRTVPELKRAYRRIAKKPLEMSDNTFGITISLSRKRNVDAYLVYAHSTSDLAHEFAHVILRLFKEIGLDPTEGNGEPFCYLLSHLMGKARK